MKQTILKQFNKFYKSQKLNYFFSIQIHPTKKSNLLSQNIGVISLQFLYKNRSEIKRKPD